MLPICIALKIISTIENISFILYVYYCHLNHLFCQILVGTPTVAPRHVHVHVCGHMYTRIINYYNWVLVLVLSIYL